MSTAHQRIDCDAGNGYTVPREYWVECSCGAIVWGWQQFYDEENPEDADEAWNAHVQWAEGRQ